MGQKTEMKIVHNHIIPFGRSMVAINLFGIVFAKKELSGISMNHEYIHTLQQRELLWVGFYILYVAEWLIRLAMTRNMLTAYAAISFEREAYGNETDKKYAQHRRCWAWIRYLKSD